MEKTIADQAVEAYLSLVDTTTAFMWPLKLNNDELPTSHIAVLHELKALKRMNLTQLAHQVSVAKQTMTDISSKLIKLGYIRRIQEETNRRQILLELTPEGRHYIGEYEYARFLYIRDHIFSALSEEQLLLLLDACNTICDLQKQTLIREELSHRGLNE